MDFVKNERKQKDRELTKLWNLKVMVIPIIVVILGAVPKILEVGVLGV